MSFVEGFTVLCPYLGESTTRGALSAHLCRGVPVIAPPVSVSYIFTSSLRYVRMYVHTFHAKFNNK